MPNSPRSADKEYLSGPRVPKARRFDLDQVADLNKETNPLGLGHMMPTGEKFAEECGKLGIERSSHVVLYDTMGIFSSPRAAYTFKAFGHEKVSVLDGGLPRWIAEGYQTESGSPVKWSTTNYSSKAANAGWVRSYEEMVRNSEKSDDEIEIVLDHRSLARYTGEAPEPRPGLSSGHIPKSLPLPFTEYLIPSSDSKPYTSYRPIEELRQILVDAAGGEEAWTKLAQGEKSLVFTCGSGMTAAIGWLANELVKEARLGGAKKTALYDESWTGYALREKSVIIKGSE
ncbi:thiosulfate/3-mercaptopyruvate sulfurtransferase [Tremella mesenterica]|uniref:Thiosulfate/3-mercaptopyruvate sulfurtransferase n=1 Tax=Tremella mesenterica TaxID=5217 RepID=A0A4Q1BJ76_TREME|nr:thiosulfate/3-mercaptopyruvate sulfurtransferase [Tremella mesenterica]